MILHRHQMRERIAHVLAKFTGQERPGTEDPIEFEVSEKPETDAPAE